MDKFGIFNLLNTLVKFYNNQKDENKTENTNNNNEKDNNINPFSAFSSILNNKANTQKQESEKQENNRKQSPLQSSMLCTIKNHDDFIKRVNANANKKTKI